jgi:GDP-D-mannose dehydratase
MPTALITGITGQDGSYLAELLLRKGYRVAGLLRRSSSGNCSRVEKFQGELELHCADLADQGSIDPHVKVRVVNVMDLFNLLPSCEHHHVSEMVSGE